VEVGTPGLASVRQEFGDEVIQDDGSLDRAKLGEIIFDDEAKRKKLNSIVHPLVRWYMMKQMVACFFRGK